MFKGDRMNQHIIELAQKAGFDRRERLEFDDELKQFAELLFNEIANTAVVSDGMFNGNERRLSVELRLGNMVKKISVFGVEE
jgi:hypothetical protein